MIPSQIQAFDPQRYTRDLRKHWSRAAPYFEPISAGFFAGATKPFFAFAGLRAGQRVLDVACGPGTSSFLAADRVAPSGSVLGVDLSAAMLKIAARKAGGRGPRLLRFKTMNAEALDLPDRAFDAAICHLGVMLYARPQRGLLEMGRVLKPGGTLACLVLGSAEKMAFTSLLTSLLARHACQAPSAGAPGLHDFGRPGRLAEAFAAIGLKKIVARRLTGVFLVESAQSYWELALKGFGRLGPLIAALPPDARRAVKEELFARLSAYAHGGRLRIPYEFVMARGLKENQ